MLKTKETSGTDNSGKLDDVAAVVSTLREVSDALDTPFLRTISGVTTLILSTVQSVRTNKEECTRMVKQISEIIRVIIRICVDADGVLPPSILDNIGRFTETLQKIQSFMRAQQDQGKFKRFFKSQDNAAQLEECKASLKQATDVFSMRTGASVVATDLETDAEQMHTQLLATDPDTQYASDGSSLTSGRGSFRYGSSGSSGSLLSLLPPCPKVFNGREEELQQVVANLLSESACVAILGTGGIGKTSLATTALHHPDVTDKYPQRYFISCESVTSEAMLLATLGSGLGLGQNNVLRSILRKLSDTVPVLLVLDNFETPWEPLESRSGVEELLSKLTDLPTLSLLVTMRGAERPGKVRWSRPFLSPLDPLTDSAAHETFIDIADDPSPEDAMYLDQILQRTGNLPLAVNLMANLAAVEGCQTVFSRWEKEKTALLSDGYDKLSSLETSIMISLSSPRLTLAKGAQELLSLLSILPNGISETELLESRTPDIPEPQMCRSTLIKTALAYLDRGRLKVLAPIREYIRMTRPPSESLVQPLRSYLRDLVDVWCGFQEQPDDRIALQLLPVLNNISSVFLRALLNENGLCSDAELKKTVLSSIFVDQFSWETLHGSSDMLPYIPGVVEKVGDDRLHGQYICHRFQYHGHEIPADEVDGLAAKGIAHFQKANNVRSEAELNMALAKYFARHTTDMSKPRQYIDHALMLAKKCGDESMQARVLVVLFSFNLMNSTPRDALSYLREFQRLVRRLGQFRGEARGLILEARILKNMGYLSRAIELCTEAQQLYVASGFQDSVPMITSMDILADIYYRKTEYSEARRIHEEIVRSTSSERAPLFHATGNANLALVDILMDTSDEGPIVEHLDASRALYAKHTFHWGLLLCDLRTADLHLRRGERAVARGLYHSLIRTTGIDNAMLGWCFSKFASPELRLDEGAPPFRWTTVYFAHVRKLDNLAGIYDALRCFGDIFLAQDETETAASLFQAALDGFTHMDIHQNRAMCMFRLAQISRNRGETEAARDMWETARPLFMRSSQTQNVAAIDRKLRDLAL
ncbi:hypothetical protein DFH09DRAFT_1026273 [Mycena vulgaris]|nr:hypothetical protein DFH09DRAFT_1026273 [Mycena vulgaris]